MSMTALLRWEQHDPLLGGGYQNGKYGVAVIQPALGGSGNVRNIDSDKDLILFLYKLGFNDEKATAALTVLQNSRKYENRLYLDAALVSGLGF